MEEPEILKSEIRFVLGKMNKKKQQEQMDHNRNALDNFRSHRSNKQNTQLCQHTGGPQEIHLCSIN